MIGHLPRALNGKRIIKIDLCESTAAHPDLGLQPCLDVYADDIHVGLFYKVLDRFMPAATNGEVLKLTLSQMDRVNKALGLPPEANRKHRVIVMNVLEHEVAVLAAALVAAKVLG